MREQSLLFWRDLKPIPNVVKSHALRQNRWCDILRATGAGLVNRHYHPHQVFAFTISGK